MAWINKIKHGECLAQSPARGEVATIHHVVQVVEGNLGRAEEHSWGSWEKPNRLKTLPSVDTEDT